MIRLVLNEAAYRDLVAGRVARLTIDGRAVSEMRRATAGIPEQIPVELILSDIGWARMVLALNDAMDEEAQR